MRTGQKIPRKATIGDLPPAPTNIYDATIRENEYLHRVVQQLRDQLDQTLQKLLELTEENNELRSRLADKDPDNADPILVPWPW